MEFKHVQAELTPQEYEALRRASVKEGRTLKQALREAALAWVRQRASRDDPVFGLIGLASGTKSASKDHDEIYDEG